MTRFRPCIDLHAGQVKQIVGGTLSTVENDLKTNYVSALPAKDFAKLYRENDAFGAHVIMLGPGNEEAAREALQAWPGKLQVGGGVNDGNAKQWIEAGAEKVGGIPTCRNHDISYPRDGLSIPPGIRHPLTVSNAFPEPELTGKW